MVALYIAALIGAAGAVGMQLFAGHEADVGGHDVDGHDAHHDVGWSFVASLRFWSFALLAFGLVGTLTSLFHLASPTVTFVAALVSGVVAGAFAVTVVRHLTQRAASSHARTSDVVGRVGRVIVPLSEGARGKVRIEVKGSYIDCVARSTDALEEGELVIVEDCESSELTVSRAPKELK